MQLVIRPFRDADSAPVCRLFVAGVKDHIRPCFYRALRSRIHTLACAVLCPAGLLLGAGLGTRRGLWAGLGAALLPGLWLSLLYFCCHRIFSDFTRRSLDSDMRDVGRSYLRFWVAEAEPAGRILGTLALSERRDEPQRVCELFRMSVCSSVRRSGVGLRLLHTALRFCQERGVAKVVLRTSSSGAPALALYAKAGFRTVRVKRRDSHWVSWFALHSVTEMEKHLECDAGPTPEPSDTA